MTQNLTNHGPKIALFEPDIPQNTAAIIRTCACLGTKLEIIQPCGFLLSDKRFKKVVMDYMDEKEIIFYKNILDLSYKLNKYKKDKKEGKKIAKNGKKKYLKYFNSDIVSEYILSKSFDYRMKKKVIWN